MLEIFDQSCSSPDCHCLLERGADNYPRSVLLPYPFSPIVELLFVSGALSTIVASYLAKARGSKEPDFSNTRVKDLEQFLRDCDAFVRDHGHVVTEKVDDELNKELITKRKRLEEILGNINPPDNNK